MFIGIRTVCIRIVSFSASCGVDICKKNKYVNEKVIRFYTRYVLQLQSEMTLYKRKSEYLTHGLGV